MARDKSMAFCQGALEALGAHIVAWGILVSTERLLHMAGHVIIGVLLEAARVFIRP